VSVDLLANAGDSDDLASAPADQDRTWHITQYLLPESDPDYDERHALSRALEDWDLDIVSEPEALISASLVLSTSPVLTATGHLPSACCFTLDPTLTI
jgi:hypothetical protein